MIHIIALLLSLTAWSPSVGASPAPTAPPDPRREPVAYADWKASA